MRTRRRVQSSMWRAPRTTPPQPCSHTTPGNGPPPSGRTIRMLIGEAGCPGEDGARTVSPAAHAATKTASTKYTPPRIVGHIQGLDYEILVCPEFLRALHVRAFGGVDLDALALVDEGRDLHRDAGLHLGGLEGIGGGGVLDARLGVDHREHHGGRDLDADGAAVVEVYLDVGVGQEVARLAFEEVRLQRELLVVLLVHEDVAVAVLVEVLHLARIDESAFDLVLGAEALVGLGALVDVLHLDLHEGAAAAADVDVVGLEHPPDALVPLEELTGTDLDCFDFGHGGKSCASKKARILHDL